MLDRASIYYRQVQLLMSVLPYVVQEEAFALKGGTAINMFVRNIPRLSVDIDLMYLPIQEREASLRHIAEIFERIARNIETSLRGSRVHRIIQRGD
jgi:predicted nucleotidyltransferase component of viral defense system